jgi:nicotinate-nucleotide adenylyltransferase
MTPTFRLGFHLEPGMRVGLFGGSFNPPHEGHVHVARTAMRALGLDRLIWLVSPGNPLKGEPAALGKRLAAVRRFARGPKMIVSDVEARLGTRFTVDTLAALKQRFPAVEFVWVMGSDNLASFHLWKRWREIGRAVPVAVVPRPGFSVRSSPGARTVKAMVLHAPLNDASSTALRARASVSSF